MKVTLKAARMNKGFTQDEAANYLGIKKDTLSNYERGKTYPNIPVLRKMERLYGIAYDNLIFLHLDDA